MNKPTPNITTTALDRLLDGERDPETDPRLLRQQLDQAREYHDRLTTLAALMLECLTPQQWCRCRDVADAMENYDRHRSEIDKFVYRMGS